MKKLLLPIGMLLAGVGVGGGSAFATRMVLGPPAEKKAVPKPTVFVPVTKILAPLVLPDGRLAGYVSFDANLEVAEDAEATVTAKLPLLLHAINMRTYRTPLAAGRDGVLPDIAGLRSVVMAAAPEAFGAGVVKRAAISRAEPT